MICVGAATLSAAVCVATVVLWVRSHRTPEGRRWGWYGGEGEVRHWTMVRLRSSAGVLDFTGQHGDYELDAFALPGYGSFLKTQLRALDKAMSGGYFGGDDAD